MSHSSRWELMANTSFPLLLMVAGRLLMLEGDQGIKDLLSDLSINLLPQRNMQSINEIFSKMHQSYCT